jgi:hypothetical protein
MRIRNQYGSQPFNRKPIPIGIFCYHKVGTILLSKVFFQLCAARKWQFQTLLGKQTYVPQNADVILFAHSLIDFGSIERPYIGIHVIRDPRDIIVSGYLFHRRTTEKWCINSDFSANLPIRFPRVPYSQEHRTEEWRMKYLESLRGMSYQDNLLSMFQRDGLLFEMMNYGTWTIESIRDWNYDLDNVLEIKFEDLMNSYDDQFRIIFEHLGFSESEIIVGLDIAARHDLGRISAKEMEELEHVSSAKCTKWKEYFEPQHKEVFIQKFGNILVDLGYESDNNW